MLLNGPFLQPAVSVCKLTSHSPLTLQDNGPDELDLALQKDAQAVKDAERERARKRRGNTNIMLLKPEPVPPKDFYHTKITTFRVISDEHQHPEVLAEWRAKRAADYVSKHPNALEPPPHRYCYVYACVRMSNLSLYSLYFIT